MSGSSIFVTYGLKSGGGPAFLRRTRNAFGQLQTRTRTGSNVQQQQARDTPCINRFWAFGFIGGLVCGSWGPEPNYNGSTSQYSSIENNTFSCSTHHRNNSYNWTTTSCYSICNTQFCYRQMQCSWRGTVGTQGGWYNTGSCSTISQNCSLEASTISQLQCQTVTQCQFPAFPPTWTNVTSCDPVTPSCTVGGVQRQCQTVFSFREEDWSAFEEADECTPSNPTPTEGAVAVECMAN
jgi:hypothetical protein